MIDINGNKITLKRHLTHLDKFVLKFISVLDKLKIKYVIVSGYVSILLGRARMTEDVDILIEKLSAPDFTKLVKDIVKSGFWCLNSDDLSELFELMKTGHSIRFAEKEIVIPNIELRFVDNSIDLGALKNRLVVKLSEHRLNISSLELQIAYKLYLGSDKDVEDARYLYKLFGNFINKRKLNDFVDILKVKDKVKYLE